MIEDFRKHHGGQHSTININNAEVEQGPGLHKPPPSKLQRLCRRGPAPLKSLREVLCVSGLDLQRLAGLSQSEVQDVLVAAASVCRRRRPITALQLQQADPRGFESGLRLSVGCPVLDQLLRGGLPAVGVTELSGQSGGGKTQLGLQLSLTVQYPREHGGLSSGALYICTEDPFPIKRLQQLISEQPALRSDVPPSLISRIRFSDQVYIEHTADLESLQVCLSCRAPILLAQGLVRIIVIDSVAALFRCEFQADNWLERNKQLLTFSSNLHRLSIEFNTPVLCINQRPDPPDHDPIARWADPAHSNLVQSDPA
ncbi:DNA repair protein XRCC3-like [Nematolebias whitei]|uniref:DNA repair protein XRCC3-like n=1 Tax=Nematolebias whitei TaxID=451745 RepID=UPI0018971E8F|nr:DNA repair protein XRCC3-like [Nematolebias whitei]